MQELRSTCEGIFIGDTKLIPYDEAVRIPGASAELLEKVILEGLFESQVIGKIRFIIDEVKLRKWIWKRNYYEKHCQHKKEQGPISLGRVLEKTGVDKETVIQAVNSKQLKIYKKSNRFYVKDELELYYLTERWVKEGKATKKWRYHGILPHQKVALQEFLKHLDL